MSTTAIQIRKTILLRSVAFTCILLSGILIPGSAFARNGSDGHAIDFGRPYKLTVDSGPVAVKISGRNTANVRMTESGIPAVYKVKYTEAGGVLRITVETSDSTTPNTSADKPPAAKAPAAVPGEIILTVPRYEFIYAKATTGNIHVDNMSTEHLTLETAGGGIAVSGTNAVLVATSDTGSQDYRHIYGSITATSHSGAISVDHEVGLMHLTTESGTIKGTNILLQTTSSFMARSGTISVSLWNNLHGCKFQLSSESGSLRVGQLKRSGTLDWGDGSVLITGKSTSGSLDFQ
jgi:hypothetical protein